MRRPQSAQVYKLQSVKQKEYNNQIKHKQIYNDDRIKLNGQTLKVAQNRYDNYDDNVTPNGPMSLHKKKSEHLVVLSYQHKIKLQQKEIDVLKEQVVLQQKCLNQITQENQDIQQEQEIQRLKNLLDEALNMPSDQKRNQYITYLTKIQELKNEIKKLKQMNDDQNNHLKQLQNNGKYQQQTTQVISSQEESKINLKKYEEKIQILQQEFSSQLQEKDMQIKELQNTLKKQNQNYQQKINNQIEEITGLQQQIEKNKDEIIQIYEQLEDRKQEILYLDEQKKELENNNQIKSNVQLNVNQSKIIFQYIYQQKQRQCQNNQSQTNKIILSLNKMQNLSFINKINKIDFSQQYQLIIENEKSDIQMIQQNQIINNMQPNIKEQFNETEYIKQLVQQYLDSFILIIKEKEDQEQEYIKIIVDQYLQSFLQQ